MAYVNTMHGFEVVLWFRQRFFMVSCDTDSHIPQGSIKHFNKTRAFIYYGAVPPDRAKSRSLGVVMIASLKHYTGVPTELISGSCLY